jgi:hypothetical protein
MTWISFVKEEDALSGKVMLYVNTDWADRNK